MDSNEISVEPHKQLEKTKGLQADLPARARFRATWGKASLEAEAIITPVGLLAIGGMVGTILLAVLPIVLASARKGSKPS